MPRKRGPDGLGVNKTVRLTAPLIEAIDRIAAREGTTFTTQVVRALEDRAAAFGVMERRAPEAV